MGIRISEALEREAMRFEFSPLDPARRAELGEFFRNSIPGRIRETVSAGGVLSKAEVVESQRILNAARLAVPHWPVRWHGRGWTAVEQAVFVEELQRAAVPLPLQFNCNMLGPILLAFGTDAQQERFLPRAAGLADWWCQGFSEPDAGSDLASLRTRAERRGDRYVVSGQKTWTSYAHHADWIFCLVRTDPAARKQEGISFLLIDMRSKGVTVRPIVTVDGRHEVNEVFFDAVEVPAENLVGRENEGWSIAKFLLASERTGIARIGLTKERVDRVRRLARTTNHDGGGSFWDSEAFRMRVLVLEAELKALEETQKRVLARGAEPNDAPSGVSSVLKLKGSELQQAATELLMEIEGPDGLRATHRDGVSIAGEGFGALSAYLNFRKVSIYGGSNEIQRGIIARTILGL